MGALLDHGPGSATVNLERTWAVLRLVFGTFLVVSGIGMVAVSAVEWSSSSAECSLQLRPWLLVLHKTKTNTNTKQIGGFFFMFFCVCFFF